MLFHLTVCQILKQLLLLSPLKLNLRPNPKFSLSLKLNLNPNRRRKLRYNRKSLKSNYQLVSMSSRVPIPRALNRSRLNSFSRLKKAVSSHLNRLKLTNTLSMELYKTISLLLSSSLEMLELMRLSSMESLSPLLSLRVFIRSLRLVRLPLSMIRKVASSSISFEDETYIVKASFIMI